MRDILNRISRIVRWGRITKAGSDTGQFAIQQMEYLGKVADGLIVFPYGVHGNVPPDSLALMFAVQGNPDNRAAIAWTPKTRPQLSEGEVAFYHPPTDAFIIWRSSGNLDIETGGSGTADINIKSGNVNIETDTWTLIGDMVVTGTITNNGKDVGDTHRHCQGNDSDGDSEAIINGVL